MRPAPGGGCPAHQAPHWVARAEPSALVVTWPVRVSVSLSVPRRCAHLRNGPWKGDPRGRASTSQASLQPLSRKPGARGARAPSRRLPCCSFGGPVPRFVLEPQATFALQMTGARRLSTGSRELADPVCFPRRGETPVPSPLCCRPALRPLACTISLPRVAAQLKYCTLSTFSLCVRLLPVRFALLCFLLPLKRLFGIIVLSTLRKQQI